MVEHIPADASDADDPVSPAVLSQARFDEWWESYWAPPQKLPVSVKRIARDAWLANSAGRSNETP